MADPTNIEGPQGEGTDSAGAVNESFSQEGLCFETDPFSPILEDPPGVVSSWGGPFWAPEVRFWS